MIKMSESFASYVCRSMHYNIHVMVYFYKYLRTADKIYFNQIKIPR